MRDTDIFLDQFYNLLGQIRSIALCPVLVEQVSDLPLQDLLVYKHRVSPNPLYSREYQ